MILGPSRSIVKSQRIEAVSYTHLDVYKRQVLSDVMMPEMSGKEMCYKIKNTVNLSHIPVVLLTAQTSVEYTIEGLSLIHIYVPMTS